MMRREYMSTRDYGAHDAARSSSLLDTPPGQETRHVRPSTRVQRERERQRQIRVCAGFISKAPEKVSGVCVVPSAAGDACRRVLPLLPRSVPAAETAAATATAMRLVARQRAVQSRLARQGVRYGVCVSTDVCGSVERCRWACGRAGGRRCRVAFYTLRLPFLHQTRHTLRDRSWGAARRRLTPHRGRAATGRRGTRCTA